MPAAREILADVAIEKLEGEMDATTQSALELKITILRDIYKIEMTPHAKVILGECLTATTVDPHPSWPLKKPQELQKFKADMLDVVPSRLAKVANERKVKKITSFDLLHAMTSIIDSICPFDKPPL